MLPIWQSCKGHQQLSTIETPVWRLNKTNYSPWNDLLDTPKEIVVLEEIINAKQKRQDKIFRNPPLEYSSRFGSKFEVSIWYGSLKIETALAEKAFYLFNFLRASGTKNSLLFEASYSKVNTQKGIDLTKPPFVGYRDVISSPTNYKESQFLGAAMRESGVEAFCYYSARTIKQETNVGIFIPAALKKGKQAQLAIWQSSVNESMVDFIQISNPKKSNLRFPIEQFLVNNELPFLSGSE